MLMSERPFDYVILKYSKNDLADTKSKKQPNILLNNFLSILYTTYAPILAITIVTGTNTKNPKRFI